VCIQTYPYGLNDAILIQNVGAIRPSQDYLELFVHYDPPKGIHMTVPSHIDSLKRFLVTRTLLDT